MTYTLAHVNEFFSRSWTIRPVGPLSHTLPSPLRTESEEEGEGEEAVLGRRREGEVVGGQPPRLSGEGQSTAATSLAPSS